MKITPLNALALAGAAFIGYQLVAAPASAQVRPGELPESDPEKKGNTNPALPDTGVKPGSAPVYPLRRGSRGQAVRALQKHLGTPVDGSFGNQTENALLVRHGVVQVDSAEQVAGWVAAAGNSAPLVSVADMDFIFGSLFVSPPVAGGDFAVFRAYTSGERQNKIAVRLAGYSAPQLARFKWSYQRRFKGYKRPGDRSLYSDIRLSLPSATWSAPFKTFMGRLSAAK